MCSVLGSIRGNKIGFEEVKFEDVLYFGALKTIQKYQQRKRKI
jgi:hypothetical protein